MLNQSVLVGRIAEEPILEEIEKKKKMLITLAVPRNYKNMNGEYDTDFIPVKLFGSVAENTKEYCKKGDMVGVKGRIQSIKMASGSVIEVIAEKVTFLANRKEEE